MRQLSVFGASPCILTIQNGGFARFHPNQNGDFMIQHGDFLTMLDVMDGIISLVGDFNPLKNMKVIESQLGLLFPIYGKVKTCSKAPTSFRLIQIYPYY